MALTISATVEGGVDLTWDVCRIDSYKNGSGPLWNVSALDDESRRVVAASMDAWTLWDGVIDAIRELVEYELGMLVSSAGRPQTERES